MGDASSHNAAILPMLKLITKASQDEAGQWVILESLCLGIGKLHGRSEKETAEFIDMMATHIASGLRTNKDQHNDSAT